jgi:hypothetical protein
MSEVLASAFYTVMPGLVLLGVALVPTILVEMLVASFFRAGRRALRAVVLVNLVTNPLLNVALTAIYGFGFGIWQTQVFVRSMGRSEFTTHTAWFFYVAFVALEVAVMFVEWGLLRWALRREPVSSKRLFAMSVCMNVASASTGLALSRLVLKL